MPDRRNVERTANDSVKDALEDSVAQLNREKGLDLSYPVDEDGHIKAFTVAEFGDFFAQMQEEAYNNNNNNKGELTFKDETAQQIQEERKTKWQKTHKGTS
jgi:hypothetical protein